MFGRSTRFGRFEDRRWPSFVLGGVIALAVGCGGSSPATAPVDGHAQADADITTDAPDASADVPDAAEEREAPVDVAPVVDAMGDSGGEDHPQGDTNAVDAPAAPDAVPDASRDAAAEQSVADGAVADVARDAGVAPTDGAVADLGGAACGVCAAYGTPAQAGRVSASNLNNLSGMAVSKKNPGVLYVHNDMTRTEFFALNEAGALLQTLSYPATAVVDVEDMAVGHCPAGSCVYLADIGGNTTSRTSYAILRISEPAIALTGAPATATVTAEKLTFSYPDGAVHNAESLLVDPAADTLYVITKLTGPSTVYRLPATFGGAAMVAQKVVDLTVPKTADGQATSASAHPCGAGFLLRTNTVAYEFRVPVGSPLTDAFTVAPALVPLLVEQQGEAIAYRTDGRGYWTTGEGTSQPLNQVTCK